MLGNEITFTVDGQTKTLKKINQDSYSSEYLLREATGEYRAKVRHSNEKAAIRGEKMARHNVEFAYTSYGSSDLDDGFVIIVSSTIRNPERSDAVKVDQISDALATFMATNGVALVNWES